MSTENKSLKKVGHLNDIAADYIPALPANGSVLKYRMLQSMTAQLMNGPIVTGSQTFFGGDIKIPPSSHFMTKEGQRVSIGLATTTDKEGNPTGFDRVWFPARDEKGEFILTMGEGNNARLFTYMELMSENAANPHRDQDVRPLFERVDIVGEAQAETDAELLEVEAMTKAGALSGAEQKIAALLFGINPDQPETIVKRDIIRAAKKDPKAFLESTASKHAQTQALLENTKRLGIVAIDVQTKSLNWTRTGSPILRVPDPADDAVTAAFIRHSTTSDGKLILEELEKEVKTAEKAITANKKEGTTGK